MFLLPYDKRLYIDSVNLQIGFGDYYDLMICDRLEEYDKRWLDFTIRKIINCGDFSYYRKARPRIVNELLKVYDNDIFTNS